MAVQITRRRMRSGGAGSPAFSALALTGGFAGTAAVPVGLAVELGVSAVFVSAWSAIGNYVNLMLGKQYKCNQTFFYKPRVVRCQADLEDSSVTFRPKDEVEAGGLGECVEISVAREERNAAVNTALSNQRIAKAGFAPLGQYHSPQGSCTLPIA